MRSSRQKRSSKSAWGEGDARRTHTPRSGARTNSPRHFEKRPPSSGRPTSSKQSKNTRRNLRTFTPVLGNSKILRNNSTGEFSSTASLSHSPRPPSSPSTPRTDTPAEPSALNDPTLNEKVQRALRELESIKAASSFSTAGRRRATPSRPSTSVDTRSNGGGKSEDLESIQSVMRKLYRRNMQLGKQIKALKKQQPGTSAGTSEVEDLAEERSVSRQRSDSTASTEVVQRLQLLLKQAQATEGHLRHRLLMAERSSQELAKEKRETAFVGSTAQTEGERPRTAKVWHSRQKELDAYKQQYTSCRRSIQEALHRRLSASAPSVSQLHKWLVDEATERQVSKMVYHRKLEELEEQNCNSVVEQRLLRLQVSELQAKLAGQGSEFRKTQAEFAQTLERLHAVQAESIRLRRAFDGSTQPS